MLSGTGSNIETAENESASKTSVSPNPANGNILIRPGKAYEVIRVYDSQGKLIEVWNITPGKTVISKDISSFPKGIYLLLFQGTDIQETVRVVKQ